MKESWHVELRQDHTSPFNCFCWRCGHPISFVVQDFKTCKVCETVNHVNDYDKIVLHSQAVKVRWEYDERMSYLNELYGYVDCYFPINIVI